jgi:hypothetical protein
MKRQLTAIILGLLLVFSFSSGPVGAEHGLTEVKGKKHHKHKKSGIKKSKKLKVKKHHHHKKHHSKSEEHDRTETD